MPDVKGPVAVVAGATRGPGRGIARMQGEAGATVCRTGGKVRWSIVSTKRCWGEGSALKLPTLLTRARGRLRPPASSMDNDGHRVKTRLLEARFPFAPTSLDFRTVPLPCTPNWPSGQ